MFNPALAHQTIKNFHKAFDKLCEHDKNEVKQIIKFKENYKKDLTNKK